MSQHNSKTLTTNTHYKQTSFTFIVIASIITIIYNLLILGYLITLEGQKCNCIMDWRHNYIKFFSSIMIIWALIIILLHNTSYQHGTLITLLQSLLMILSLVNIWCLFTYVGDLDRTRCSCAVEKQRDLHYFLYIWRYVLVGSIVFSLIMIILTTLAM